MPRKANNVSEKLFGKELSVEETAIPGLLVLNLPVHGDNRGWFKENWQRKKMGALGLPDFGPVQNNISFNTNTGTTRGIHAEPWDKFVSVASGRIFGAWVDLREGDSFGQVFTTEVDPSKAIYVPRGVGNAFQTLEPDTAYSYLVNDHWSPQASYTFLNLADQTSAIEWPIPLDQAELSDKDKSHPQLSDVTPMKRRGVFVVGADGQLGKALRDILPDATFVNREGFDITDESAYDGVCWQDYDTVINAAAMTNVDGAETLEGRKLAWNVNVRGTSLLARKAIEHSLRLVHISSDYVFDGTIPEHDENELFAPLGVYGQSKAAGDVVVAAVPKHYTLRTSWVIGEGNNFVRTMRHLADRDIKPSVVSDQIGRLTFTTDLARAVRHLLEVDAPYGTYNLSNDGDPVSWADIASEVYRLSGKSEGDITPVTTAEYYDGKEGIAPRPLQSTLKLGKIKATGFTPRDWREALTEYLSTNQ